MRRLSIGELREALPSIGLIVASEGEGVVTPYGHAVAKSLATFNGDIAEGHLVLLPHTSQSFLLAESLLGAHLEIPLRTLDALQLGVMRAAGAGILARADRLRAEAGTVLGIECRGFF